MRIKTVSIKGTLDLGEERWPADAAALLASSADVIALPAGREAVRQGTLLDLTPFVASDPNVAREGARTNLSAQETLKVSPNPWGLCLPRAR